MAARFSVHVSQSATAYVWRGEFEETIVVGRSEECDVHLPDQKASRRHATISLSETGQVTVRDLGSTNGTRVGGETLRNEAIAVPGRAIVRIGPFLVVVSDASLSNDPDLTSIDAIATSVNGNPADLTPAIAPDGTVTILFSDIAGSTALNERLGDTRWMDRLRIHNKHVRTQLAAHGGYEVKNQGDGFMLAFGSAIDGLRCATAIQTALSTVEAPDRLAVRIGLHTGEAIHEDDDYFGKHVALAARIGDAASGDQILVSEVVHSLTESNGAFRFDRGREIALKGLEGTHRIYQLLWQDDDAPA